MGTINYTKTDQDEVRDELITNLKNTPSFKDANFTGTVLYDLANTLSYNAALYGFYVNQVANEPFIDTAKQYKNINRISKTQNYNPIGKGSAIVAVSSRLSKTYSLNNMEGFIEIPAYTQFPSTKSTTTGESFAFVNEKPLIVQVSQFGMNTVRETDLEYTGEVTGTTLDATKLTIIGQSKKPIQIVINSSTIEVVETTMVSEAHETLTTFVTDTVYSLIYRLVGDSYKLAIMPKTTTPGAEEILRFKIASDRTVTIVQNFSANKMYLGRMGFKNLVYTSFETIPFASNPLMVSKVRLKIPRYAPVFQVLYNGETFSFSSETQDIIIESDDIKEGSLTSGIDAYITLQFTDVNELYYGSKLVVKNTADLLTTDIVIGIIPGTTIENGNIILAENTVLTTGSVKSGTVNFNEGETAKRVVFEKPFDFNLPTAEIPLTSAKNYSIFLYANGNIRTFYSVKTTNGFVVNVEPDKNFTGQVLWKAIEYVRQESQQKTIDTTGIVGVDFTKPYAVMLQSGVNVTTWISDISSKGFKIGSDTSFVGDVDYLIVPENDMSKVPDPTLAGTEYIIKNATEKAVTFDTPRANTDYTVFLQPEDNVNVWFENKTTEGFTIRIEENTDFYGKVDWQLYESKLSKTVHFGGGDKFQQPLTVQYNDLSDSSYLGFLTQGIAVMSQVEETGLLTVGINGLTLDYDTDITVNPGLSFEVLDTTISYSNIRVFVKTSGSWVEWTEAKNYKNQIESTSAVFYVRVNKDKRISLKFGSNDIRGKDPTGSKIVIIGLQCVGEEGNIGENVLSNEILGSLNFLTSNIVTDSVEKAVIDLLSIRRSAFFGGLASTSLIDYNNNIITSSDLTAVQLGVGIMGTEPEDIESIRVNSQFAYISQNRLVSPQDYKTLITNEFSNFIRDVEVYNYKEARDAGLIASDEIATNYFNTLFFMMVPMFGTSFTISQKQLIYDYINDKTRKSSTIESVVLEPTFVSIDVTVSYSQTVNASPLEVRNNITNGIYQFFKRQNRSLGETITSYAVQQSINQNGLTQLTLQLFKDVDNKNTASDYKVDITPDQYQSNYSDVQAKNLDEVVKKELRNLLDKGIIKLNVPLFNIETTTGATQRPFSGDIVLQRFEFPILGDVVIEKV
jgi:hypothetical protein